MATDARPTLLQDSQSIKRVRPISISTTSRPTNNALHHVRFPRPRPSSIQPPRSPANIHRTGWLPPRTRHLQRAAADPRLGPFRHLQPVEQRFRAAVATAADAARAADAASDFRACDASATAPATTATAAEPATRVFAATAGWRWTEHDADGDSRHVAECFHGRLC